MTDPTAGTADDLDLSERDREVLRTLAAEGEGDVAFQGLRRRLGVHQESLTRTLRRLQEDRLVERTNEGYRLRAEGTTLAGRLPAGRGETTYPVVRTLLPGPYAARAVVEALRHRWFGRLRWFGASQERGETVLSWTTPDGEVRLDARFRDILLAVDVRLTDRHRFPEALAAAQRLLAEVAQASLNPTDLPLPGPDS